MPYIFTNLRVHASWCREWKVQSPLLPFVGSTLTPAESASEFRLRILGERLLLDALHNKALSTAGLPPLLYVYVPSTGVVYDIAETTRLSWEPPKRQAWPATLPSHQSYTRPHTGAPLPIRTCARVRVLV